MRGRCTPPALPCSRRSAEAGVDCLFANFGSDHTGLIEAIAAAREQGHRIPNVIAVPAEMVALSAAHGTRS
jgi:acetolactate synthase-1/2/3 large subunit